MKQLFEYYIQSIKIQLCLTYSCIVKNLIMDISNIKSLMQINLKHIKLAEHYLETIFKASNLGVGSGLDILNT